MKSKILDQYTDEELSESFCRDVAGIKYDISEGVDIDAKAIYLYPVPNFCKNWISGELWKQLESCGRYEILKQGKLYTIRIYDNGNVYDHQHEIIGRAIVIALLKKDA